MSDVNISLGRGDIDILFRESLDKISDNVKVTDKRCIYVHGGPGVGKSQFVSKILKELNYDIIRYTVTDIKNKEYLELLYKNGVSKNSVRGLITNSFRRNIIVIDDNLSPDSIEKNILSSFIKLVRPKKNKRQVADETCISFPIVCVCNSSVDKYTKPLMDACICIHLPDPTFDELVCFTNTMGLVGEDAVNTVTLCNNDLTTLSLLIRLKKNNHIDISNDVLIKKNNNMHTKKVISEIINHGHGVNYHDSILNEQDGNIGGLLIHENIIDKLEKKKFVNTSRVYYDIIYMLCKTDINDRYIFGNQSWCISEPNNILKVMYPTNCVRKHIPECKELSDIRFTKILNKHNIEHNNYTFVTYISNKLMMNRFEMIDYFTQMRQTNDIGNIHNTMLSKYDISSIEITRLFKYIDSLYCCAK